MIEVKMTKMFQLKAGDVIDFWEGDDHFVVTILEVDLRRVKYHIVTDRGDGEHNVTYQDFLDQFAIYVDGLTQYESKVL